MSGVAGRDRACGTVAVAGTSVDDGRCLRGDFAGRFGGGGSEGSGRWVYRCADVDGRKSFIVDVEVGVGVGVDAVVECAGEDGLSGASRGGDGVGSMSTLAGQGSGEEASWRRDERPWHVPGWRGRSGQGESREQRRRRGSSKSHNSDQPGYGQRRKVSNTKDEGEDPTGASTRQQQQQQLNRDYNHLYYSHTSTSRVTTTSLFGSGCQQRGTTTNTTTSPKETPVRLARCGSNVCVDHSRAGGQLGKVGVVGDGVALFVRGKQSHTGGVGGRCLIRERTPSSWRAVG